MNEYHKLYRETHKDKIQEYRENNIDEKREYNKRYYAVNKKSLNKKRSVNRHKKVIGLDGGAIKPVVE